MKINLIICVFVHLLNLISREKFEPEPGFELGPVIYEAETWKFNKNLGSKLYLDGNGLFKEIGEMFKIRRN